MARFDARATIEHQLRNLAQVQCLTDADVQEALEMNPEMVTRMAQHLEGNMIAQARGHADCLLQWLIYERLRRAQRAAQAPGGFAGDILPRGGCSPDILPRGGPIGGPAREV